MTRAIERIFAFCSFEGKPFFGEFLPLVLPKSVTSHYQIKNANISTSQSSKTVFVKSATGMTELSLYKPNGLLRSPHHIFTATFVFDYCGL